VNLYILEPSSSSSSSYILIFAGPFIFLQDYQKEIFFIFYCFSPTPNPSHEDQRIPFRLVITFDLSDIEDPANSYTTAITATRTI
jgi:hypothetical protein